MGRVISGVNGGAGDSASSTGKIFSLRAAAAILANDLVVLSEVGTIRPARASANGGIATENNSTAGPVASRALANLTASNYILATSSGTINGNQMCRLSGGLLALVYSGDGTTVSTGVNLQILSDDGGRVLNTVTVTSDLNIASAKVYALANGNALITWTSGTTAKFAIYGPDGAVVTAATNIPVAAVVASIGCVQLLSGDIIIAYRKSANDDLAFQRYSAAGVATGAEVIVEAAITGANIFLLACANGEFVIQWYKATTKLARYSAVGAVVVAATSIANSTTNISNGNSAQRLIELSGGNIVFVATQSASNPVVMVVTAALTNPTAVAIAAIGTGYPPAIRAVGAGFVVASSPSGAEASVTISVCNATGFILNSFTFTLGVAGNNGPYSQYYLDANAGFVTVVRLSYTQANACQIDIASYGYDGVIRGSVINTLTVSGQQVGLAVAFNPDLSLVIAQQGTSTGPIRTAAYRTSRSSIFGVALAGGSAGDAVQVGTVGTFNINQNIVSGGTFNQRAAAVPGNRGTVAGNTAFLLGTDASGV